MRFLGRLFGQSDNSGGDPPSMPWDQRPSILEFIRSHIVDGKPGVSEAGYTLPDEERISEGSKIRFAPGAMDGILTHHMGHGDGAEQGRPLRIHHCRAHRLDH